MGNIAITIRIRIAQDSGVDGVYARVQRRGRGRMHD